MAIEIESCLIDVLMRRADHMTRCFVCRLLESYLVDLRESTESRKLRDLERR